MCNDVEKCFVDCHYCGFKMLDQEIYSKFSTFNFCSQYCALEYAGLSENDLYEDEEDWFDDPQDE